MVVGVPQAADVLDFITADFARLPRRVDPVGARTIARRAAPLAHEPLRLHVAAHGRVRRHRAEPRIRRDTHAQIVDVQLIAPTGVRVVLRAERLPHRLAHRGLLTGIRAQPPAQLAHGIDRRVPRLVVPALERRARKAHRRVPDGMLPLARGQGGERVLELPFLRWRGQERAHHRKTQLRPAVLSSSGATILRHRFRSSRAMARSDARATLRLKRHRLRIRHALHRACSPRWSSGGSESGGARSPASAAHPRTARADREADRCRRRAAPSDRARPSRTRCARTPPATSGASASACPHSRRAGRATAPRARASAPGAAHTRVPRRRPGTRGARGTVRTGASAASDTAHSRNSGAGRTRRTASRGHRAAFEDSRRGAAARGIAGSRRHGPWRRAPDQSRSRRPTASHR
jgi:hypothetical protein